MRVECYGGAHDGAVFEVSPDCEWFDQPLLRIKDDETGMEDTGCTEVYVRTRRHSPEGVVFELQEVAET